MRTTIRVDDELLAEAKARAARSRISLNQFVEDALRAALARAPGGADWRRVELPTFGGNGLKQGVNLDDSAALNELMDEWDAAR